MSNWKIILKDSFYSIELGSFDSLDEAIEEAEASYASEWSEIYDGNEGISREDMFDKPMEGWLR